MNRHASPGKYPSFPPRIHNPTDEFGRSFCGRSKKAEGKSESVAPALALINATPAASSSTTASGPPAVLSLELEGGSFDAYHFELRFLRGAYLPSEANTANYPALYAEIIRRQGLGQKTFEFDLHFEEGGELYVPAICEPMSDEPFTPLGITGELKYFVKLKNAEYCFPDTVTNGPGYEGTIEREDGDCVYGMPESATGRFKVRKI